MKSNVFACTMRASLKENMFQKLGRLIDALEIGNSIKPGDLTAIKLHFGERGNTAYIRPIYIRQVVDQVRKIGAKPFITDANTLYVGTRANSADHLQTAILNGFAYPVVDAPLTIADGLRGTSASEIPVNLEHIKTAWIGSDVVEADAYISVAHFKLHELSGYGGAIKNTGMGCASRRGKLAQHSNISPKVNRKSCKGCGECVARCAQDALSVQEVEGSKKAVIDPEKCVGCADCILACKQGSIQIQWNESIPVFLKKMVEYTAATVKGKEKKSFYINFLTDISPACDCFPFADAPLVRDIGILASSDPVAIDQASVDLLNKEGALPGTCIESGGEPGTDKIRAVYPNVDWEVQLEYAEKIGLGSRDYELVWLKEKGKAKKH